MGRNNAKIVLSEKAEKWLILHYKHTKNAEICEKLGISESSLHRFARRLGLTKTRQFMKKAQAATAAAAKLSHLRHGTYPKKGYIIPGSEQYRFKPGEKPVDRLGEKREAARVAKAVASRAQTFKVERARSVFGLEQRTKLRVRRQPQKKIQQRYYLRKRGYILDEKERTAYYTGDTRRALKLEARPKCFYRFAPMPVEAETVNAR